MDALSWSNMTFRKIHIHSRLRQSNLKIVNLLVLSKLEQNVFDIPSSCHFDGICTLKLGAKSYDEKIFNSKKSC